MSLASTLSSKRLAILKDRAQMLAQSREFFDKRGLLEVDCPILTQGASIDAHIDLMPALYSLKETRYLHSSPEYGMKRLLAEGIGDIYQISHVFRDGECGYKHNPEFMMAEWYRVGMSFEDLIKETLEYVKLFIGPQHTETLSYREAFLKYAHLDYVHKSEEELLAYCQSLELPIYPEIINEGKDALLNMILGSKIEPQLGKDKLTVLAYYPSTQAALAKTRMMQEEKVAERFEIYFQGVELANGYHELTDADEQRIRFMNANVHRQELGKQPLPIDEFFLAALKTGLPDCSGVAVGMDRLMMLRHETANIADVIPFDWSKA